MKSLVERTYTISRHGDFATHMTHTGTTTRYIRPLAILALSIAICLAVLALQRAQPAQAAPPVIDIMASDYAFDAPDTLPAGLVTVRLMNHGNEPHHAQLLRLNPDVSFPDFAQALQDEGEGALKLVTLTGGPGALSPFKSAEVTLNLTPGDYVLACFISSDDGVPHLAKGMLKPIAVQAAETQETTSPASAGTLNMRDFTFDIPDTVPAGLVTYTVVNNGPQPHELNILKLAPGATATDVLAWSPEAGTPPPFEAVGGMNGLSQGEADYVTVDLDAGNYVAICNIPDPNTGLPHSHLGMIRPFTVQ
jgi:hypothetical protein